MSRVQRGHGGGQLILGEAGIGKSRLIEWLTNEARHRGQDIVVGRAWDAAHPTAMAPIQEALLQCRPLIDYAASHDAGPHLSLIGHLLPSRQGPLDPEPTPVLLAHAALASLDTAAPGTIVVIEDLHAADLETVAAVRHMLTHAGTTRILVIATARTTELTMDRWTGSDIGRITLERLAPDDIRALAAAQMDCDHDDLDVELMRRLELAEGLPLLAEDLIADTLDTGDVSDPLSAVPPAHALPGPSERFPDLVRRRLDMLDAHATILVQAAATLGPILELGVLADAVELDTRQLQNALAAAADAQLLSRDGSRFRHALTRDVVRAATPSFQRRAVAQRVAAALVDPPHHLSVECAELLVEAGARDRAASLLVRSARRERRVGANTSAASLLSRAREIAPEESPTALASVLLIEILIDLGRVRDAAAIALAERSTMPADDRIEVSLLLAAGAASAFDHEALDRHLSAAMSALADQDPRWPRAMTLDALRTLQFAGDLDRRRRAEAQAHEAVARAEAQGDRVALCDAWMVVGRCARFRDLDQGAAAYERAMDIATLDGLRRRRLDALQELGTIDLLTWRGPSRLEQA